MDTFTATMIAEGCPETVGIDPQDLTLEDVVDAWQHLIDTGVAWQLQGSFGRQAAAMIDAGLCERRL
jgi:hypothetical protein